MREIYKPHAGRTKGVSGRSAGWRSKLDHACAFHARAHPSELSAPGGVPRLLPLSFDQTIGFPCLPAGVVESKVNHSVNESPAAHDVGEPLLGEDMATVRRGCAWLLADDHVLGRLFRQAPRALIRADARATAKYLRDHSVHKLHLGCGFNILPTWLNTDRRPGSKRLGTVRLDATKRLPFDDGQFHYIFSEHMIEHLSFEDGGKMLRECRRVLQPGPDGGKIRITTPDLAFLVALHAEPKSDLQERYVAWAARHSSLSRTHDCFVINNFVRAWGHQFIYDERTLRASLDEAGFTKIVRRKLNESEDSALSGLEHDSRMPTGFLALESMTLEAVA